MADPVEPIVEVERRPSRRRRWFNTTTEAKDYRNAGVFFACLGVGALASWGIGALVYGAWLFFRASEEATKGDSNAGDSSGTSN